MAISPSKQGAFLSQPATSTSSAVLFFSNGTSSTRLIMNDSAGILYVALAATASATAFTYKLAAGASQSITGYGGPVSGILDTGTGTARCTEF